ncbi:response regulator [Paracoccus benzoatiresistens]|uniref:Response regulator n=1 Tax=Paracoccus benzoatiresistens TaxID=2997341 RepID=A0ABT4J9U8_9RHOB|nr:response regulator [Paracoccus sp. EF6]MCZ0963856.1 response regulator [Paracoccus sp. EF6]
MPAHVILVAEDEPLLRMSMIMALEEAGFDAVGARNAREAITVLEMRPDIRLIFTDVDMGKGEDGLWLASQVRDRWPPVLIIVTSGHHHVSTEMMPQGARFFAKPYSVDQIIGQIRELAA